MINALHLLWIVPLSAGFGFLLSALLMAAGRSERGLHGMKTEEYGTEER